MHPTNQALKFIKKSQPNTNSLVIKDMSRNRKNADQKTMMGWDVVSLTVSIGMNGRWGSYVVCNSYSTLFCTRYHRNGLPMPWIATI